MEDSAFRFWDVPVPFRVARLEPCKLAQRPAKSLRKEQINLIRPQFLRMGSYAVPFWVWYSTFVRDSYIPPKRNYAGEGSHTGLAGEPMKFRLNLKFHLPL